MLAKITLKLVALLVAILVIDPSDLIFHLKMPLFFLVFFAWIMDKFLGNQKILIKKDIIFIVFVFLLIPVFGLMSGLMQNNIEDMDAALGFVKSFFMIILLYIVVDRQIPIDKHIVKFSLIIPVIIFPIYLILLWNPELFKSLSVYLVDQKNAAVFSVRDFYGYKVIMLFYRTCPLLVFPLAFFLDRFFKDKKIYDLLLFIVVFLTLIISGTRANMVSAVVIPVGMLLVHLLNKRRFFLLGSLVSILLYCSFLFLNSIANEKSDESVDIKSGHFKSIIALFDSNPQILLWGQGLGSKYYSIGTNTSIVQSELTYLELIRFFGLPLTIVLLFIMIYPIVNLHNNKINSNYRYTLFGYGGYLFIAGTNPLLISSTGMIVIVAMYSVIYKNKNNLSTKTNLNLN